MRPFEPEVELRNPDNDTGRDILGITRKNNNQQDG